MLKSHSYRYDKLNQNIDIYGMEKNYNKQFKLAKQVTGERFTNYNAASVLNPKHEIIQTRDPSETMDYSLNQQHVSAIV